MIADSLYLQRKFCYAGHVARFDRRTSKIMTSFVGEIAIFGKVKDDASFTRGANAESRGLRQNERIASTILRLRMGWMLGKRVLRTVAFGTTCVAVV